MQEGAPQPHMPYDGDPFEVSPTTEKSPMEQELSFNVDTVFSDLERIIPDFNQYVKDRGEEIPERMYELQNEALNTMRSIKNAEGSRLGSKEELIAELDRRTKDEDPDIRLSDEARELIVGIL